ncbi:unnamed protein product [Schistosoma mattheei]|uniref:Uncharacterized protein n=1 Tax=Schistosoma mattheei TaxID=31246 RepID=A0A183PJZ5_9TREM|nr:unnamed protein product [Schistosoma mattheei]
MLEESDLVSGFFITHDVNNNINITIYYGTNDNETQEEYGRRYQVDDIYTRLFTQSFTHCTTVKAAILSRIITQRKRKCVF